MSGAEATRRGAGPEEVTGPVPLTPVQRWFFSRVDGGAAPHFNLSLLLETVPFAAAPLAAALRLLPLRHDALRLRFGRGAAGWEQRLEASGAAAAGLLVLDLSALPAERMAGAVSAVARDVQASLDLNQGPVQRVVSFDLGAGRSPRLLWVVHHLVLDAISWRVLLQDLAVSYGCLARGLPLQLPPRTTPFKRWAELLAAHAGSPEIEAEWPFWRDVPWGAVTPLPVDFPGGANLQSSERSVALELDREETRILLAEALPAWQTKIKEALLSAVVRAFAAWTAAPLLLVHVEGHGRMEVFPGVDLSRTVGWFTTFTPMVLDLGRALDPGSALASVKEQLRQLPASGIGFGLLRDRIPRLPAPEVGFNYIGQLDAAEADSGGFRLAPEASGPQRSPRLLRFHLLELEFAIKDGRLLLSCLYSQDAHRQATAERLLAGVAQALRELIAQCPRATVEAEAGAGG